MATETEANITPYGNIPSNDVIELFLTKLLQIDWCGVSHLPKFCSNSFPYAGHQKVANSW